MANPAPRHDFQVALAASCDSYLASLDEASLHGVLDVLACVFTSAEPSSPRAADEIPGDPSMIRRHDLIDSASCIHAAMDAVHSQAA